MGILIAIWFGFADRDERKRGAGLRVVAPWSAAVSEQRACGGQMTGLAAHHGDYHAERPEVYGPEATLPASAREDCEMTAGRQRPCAAHQPESAVPALTPLAAQSARVVVVPPASKQVHVQPDAARLGASRKDY